MSDILTDMLKRSTGSRLSLLLRCMAKKIDKTFNSGVWNDYLADQTALLPPIPDVEHISPRVIPNLGGNPGEIL